MQDIVLLLLSLVLTTLLGYLRGLRDGRRAERRDVMNRTDQHFARFGE